MTQYYTAGRWHKLGENAFRFAVLVLLALVFLLPLVWVLITSVKSEIEVRIHPTALLPEVFHWDNYLNAWNNTNFGVQFLNSLLMASGVCLGQILTSVLAGYAFSRMNFLGKNFLYGISLLTLMVPYQLLALPIFVLLANLGMVDTYWALILPSVANAFGVFLLKQHIDGIPVSLEEAAFMDGAGRLRILGSIVVPLSKGPVVTLLVLTFIAEWNDLFKPLVYTSSAWLRTVQLGLTTFQEQFTATYTLLMAAVAFVTLPTVILFFLAQKQLIAGIASSGMKD